MLSRRTMVIVVGMVLCLTAATGTAGAQTKIRMAAWGDEWQARLTQEILRGFHEQHPDIIVEYEYLPWGLYWERLQVQIAGGVAPDVMAVNGVYLPLFVRSGAILNLQPLIERDAFPIEEAYFDASGIFAYGGDWYGIPMTGDVTGIYYNQDAFDVLGLPLPDWNWTWNEMRALASRLTLRSGDEVTEYGVNLNLRDNSEGQISWANFLYQFGTSVYNEDQSEVILNNPRTVEMVRFITEMVQEDGSVFLPGIGVSTLQTFAQGRFAMTVELVPPVIQYFRENVTGFTWDIMPMPAGSQPASQTNWVGYAASAATQHPEAVWKLLQYLAGPEAQRLIAQRQTAIPSLKEVAFSSDFLLGDLPPHRLGEFLNAVMPHARPLEFGPGYAQWASQVGYNFYLAYTGAIPPEQAVEQAADVVASFLDMNR